MDFDFCVKWYNRPLFVGARPYTCPPVGDRKSLRYATTYGCLPKWSAPTDFVTIITSITSRFTNIYREFPSRFWMVVGVSFVDQVGGRMLFPFFSLYITQKFGVGMTQAGIILGIFSILGLFGGMIGGALTDRFGR